MKSTDHIELGIDKNFNFLLPAQKNPENTYYKATFSPKHPSIGEKHESTNCYYQSLTSKNVSLIGQNLSGSDPWIRQIAIVIPRTFKDGTHFILPEENGEIFAAIAADGEVSYATEGEVTFERDNSNQTITARFQFKATQNGVLYNVQNGELRLIATGPL
ncbi:hypothetical protein [Pseudomonas sp. JL3]|uniref:hypothetical protein n=1 Tax=Pseudomonas sp. JL3 TaxID=2919943 RepID=UPI00218AFC1B|nr:hypothetical protein [Pseudomonas sp. JL3]MDR8368057.1 hypothetical protein [Pseudomonas sp. JL3]URM26086.1 hypothetical protein LLY42_19250 [Pseudomonas frederiksbergensis]